MTTEKKHKKHALLTRVEFGQYARNEFALMGAPCEEIKSIAEKIIRKNSAHLLIGYTDTDHRVFKGDIEERFTDAGATTSVTDQGEKRSVVSQAVKHDFDTKIDNQALDLMIVNGNHHTAKHQFLIVNEEKQDSLQRNRSKLTDVKGVYLNGRSEVPKWMMDLIPEQTPVYSSTEALSEAVVGLYGNPPELKGLVLAGGKSVRMGEDKALLKYFDKPQFEHVYELLRPYCDSIYLSVAEDKGQGSSIPLIKDRFTDLGPYGGILSAMMSDPNAAWLVMAVDLPGMNAAGLDQLVEARDTTKYATAFYNEATGFPDPLCTIWEPRSYMRMLEFLSIGYSCPRKVLINSEIHMVHPTDPRILDNINTPEEREQFTG